MVAGDVDARRLKALLDAQLGKLENPPKGLEGGSYMYKLSLPSVHVCLVDRPGAPQSEVRVATSGLPRSTKSYALAEVANNVFGAIVNRTAPASAAVSGDSAASSAGTTDPWANFSY